MVEAMKKLQLAAVLMVSAALLGVNTGGVFRPGQFIFANFPITSGNEGAPVYGLDTKRLYFSDGVSWGGLAFIDAFDVIANPEGSKSTNATRIAQTTFDGASFYTSVPIRFNRIILRVTGMSGTPTGRFLIYQSTTGTDTVTLLGSVVTQAIGTTGNFAFTPSQGAVVIQPGTYFILFGRDSAAGSFTMRTYTTQAVDLLTGNVDADTHPTSFNTTIASNTTPASLDARSAPAGQFTASSSDLIPVIRFKSL